MPPSLAVIAGLITHKKSLQYVVAQLEDACYCGNSYSQLMYAGMPLVKVATAPIGHGLTVGYTETVKHPGTRHGLVWVNELACHDLCAILGRICQGNLSCFEWLERIEKKHLEWIDRIPSV